MSDRLWAVTCLFNPAGFRNRPANYHTFRQHLPFPLLAVELAFNGRPFELGPGDADILVQLRHGDVMWQKERLLNVGFARLPAECDRVVWVDADVICPDPDWTDKVNTLLDEYPLGQAFRRVYYLPPGRTDCDSQGAGVTWQFSTMAAAGGGTIGPELISPPGRPNGSRITGMAWAARRELLDAHGLYDANIIGGGDLAMLFAAGGRPDVAAARQHLTGPRWEYFWRWAEPFHQAVGKRIAWADADLFHLWHGSFTDRRSLGRYRRLNDHDFNPSADIAVSPEGAWVWASDKPALHADIRDYFASRNEDAVPSS